MSSSDEKTSHAENTSDTDHEPSTCPLCLEDLDNTDKQFQPCVCGYQICLWCWHSICEKGNGLCPACRTPYQHTANTSTKSLTTYDAEQLLQTQTQRRKDKRAAATVASSAQQQQQSSSEDLTDIRIIQRNLVYVVGLPQHLARSDIIQKKELFGKYGKIIKVACSRAPKIPLDKTLNSYSAYITYKSDAAAAECIKHTDGSTLDGHAPQTVRCTYGTTKYCETWLNGRTCTSQTCLYLHSRAKPQDITTKEQLSLMWQNERAHEPQHGAAHATASPSNTHSSTTPTSTTVAPAAPAAAEHTRTLSYASTLHTANNSNGATAQPADTAAQSAEPAKSVYTSQLTAAHMLQTAADTAEQAGVQPCSHLAGVPSTKLHISTNYASRLRLQATHLPFDFSNFLQSVLGDIPPLNPEQLFGTVDDTQQLVYVQAVK